MGNNYGSNHTNDELLRVSSATGNDLRVAVYNVYYKINSQYNPVADCQYANINTTADCDNDSNCKGIIKNKQPSKIIGADAGNRKHHARVMQSNRSGSAQSVGK